MTSSPGKPLSAPAWVIYSPADGVKKTFCVLGVARGGTSMVRSEEHTSELQSRSDLVCRLLLERYADHRELHSFPTRRSSDLKTKQPEEKMGSENQKDAV